jgi:phosphate/sulfate permease
VYRIQIRKVPSGRKCEVKKHDSYDVVALVLSSLTKCSLIVHILLEFHYKMSEMFVEFCAHFFFFFLVAKCWLIGTNVACLPLSSAQSVNLLPN